MGLLGMFAKKAAVNLVRAGAQKTASEANKFEDLPKSANKTSVTKEETVIRTILENTAGAVRNGNQITFPQRGGLEITLMEAKTLISESRTKNPFTAEIRFFIALPKAESLLTDRYISFGVSMNDAVSSAAKKFCAFLNSMFELIDGGEDDLFENYFDGELHLYKYGRETVVATIGDPAMGEVDDLFRCIKNDLSPYLGAKKYYWLSIDVLFNDDHMDVHCRINNEDIDRLCDILREHLAQFFKAGTCGQYQQQLLIEQSSRTYVPRKDNYNEAYNKMYKYVRECIPIIGNSSILVSYDELYRKILAVTGDDNSAWEVITFLPEVYVQEFFKVKGTGLVAMERGSQQLALTEFQISPIRVIKSEVEKFFSKNEPSEEFNQNIFSLSSRFSSAVKALQSGVKEEELAFGVLACKAPEDYVIW
ncbi:DUF6348 family protein [Ruminococcus sp.]|uniref:DUF6348 family protein n=1 Tax=Ruminococcus sp. TaxID=41978 RepID=UPI0025F30F0B|nr:DUF6348 family protein [Ruminococcus sp.]MBQ8967876.1 hypothetical protein [Ruminococcus sp.]